MSTEVLDVADAAYLLFGELMPSLEPYQRGATVEYLTAGAEGVALSLLGLYAREAGIEIKPEYQRLIDQVDVHADDFHPEDIEDLTA